MNKRAKRPSRIDRQGRDRWLLSDIESLLKRIEFAVTLDLILAAPDSPPEQSDAFTVLDDEAASNEEKRRILNMCAWRLR